MNPLFGLQGQDKITGFAGVITGHIEYISGCNQLLLVPPVDKEGKKREGEWFDEQRIEVIGNSRIKLDNSRTPGPDQAPPGGSTQYVPRDGGH